MIPRSIVAAAVLALALPAAALEAQEGGAKATAQREIESLRQKLAADKKLVITENLGLSDAEEKAFWPIYEEYQKELNAINDKLTKTLKAYADAYNKGGIPDSTAKSLLLDSIAIEEAEVKLKKAIVAKLQKALPASRVARYMQIENKIRAIVRLDLAASVPLAGYKD
jgi:hypothetical protein